MQRKLFSQSKQEAKTAYKSKGEASPNGGYAMVLVIVAIAFGLILVGVLMNISLLNYQMKTTEYKAKDNFYSAEVVLDQIHAGLEQEVSDAAGIAYSKTMQTYGTTGSTEITRMTSFRETYLVNLRNSLCAAGDDSKYYIGGDDSEFDSGTGLYTKGLLSYLDKELIEKYRERGSRTTDIINVVSADGSYTMMTTASGLVLKNIKVSYVDASGFYNEIQTDIHIGFPDVSLQEASVIPNVFDYSFIADTGVVSEADSAKITDSLYAGTDGLAVKSGKLSLEGARYLVTPGSLQIANGAKLDIYDGTVWAGAIDVDGGSLNAGFASSYKQPEVDYYVSDDLTITGKNAVVNLSGNYYGFCGDTDALDAEDNRNQSAMIVNGSKVTLKLTDLDSLLLGGNAYIGTGNSEEVKFVESEENASMGMTGGQNKNVLLGNSLAVKTDQIAFLAPAECLGTSGGQTIIGKNPMTASEYQKWISTKKSDANYKLLDETRKVNLLGKSLSEYFGEDTGTHYQTVFQTIHGESICYVYLKMTPEQAAAYYQDYAAAAESAMKSYAAKYQNSILVSSTYTDIASRGNIYTYNKSNSTLTILPNTLTEGSEQMTQYTKEREQYQQNFDALCSKLTTNYSSLTETEKKFFVYHNLINTSELDKLPVNGKKTYVVDGYKAIVTNNKGGDPVKVNQSSDKIKLLIASGDVEVQGNFSGLIIAGGTITIRNYSGATLAADKAMVTRLLQARPTEDSDTKSLIETYFINGSRYVFSGDTAGSSSVLNLTDVIAFQNWTKQ